MEHCTLQSVRQSVIRAREKINAQMKKYLCAQLEVSSYLQIGGNSFCVLKWKFTEEIIKEHLAEFSILTDNNAKLFFNNVVGSIYFYKDM